MVYLLHPRDSVIENLEKMINCGDPDFGRSIRWRLCHFPLQGKRLHFLTADWGIGNCQGEFYG